MKLRGLFLRELQTVFHAADAADVACRQGGLFCGGLARGLAREGDFAAGAVKADGQVRQAQALLLNVGFDGGACLGIEIVQGGRVVRGLVFLDFLAAEQFFASVLDEAEQSHISAPLLGVREAGIVPCAATIAAHEFFGH